MKEKLLDLLKVKTIVTLILTIVFAILSLTGKIGTDQVMTIFSIVIAFYFGTQAAKKKDTAEAADVEKQEDE